MRKLAVIAAIGLAGAIYYYNNHNAVKNPEPEKPQIVAINALPAIDPPNNCPKYNRLEQYGQWVDADGDCMETRAEVLQAYNDGELVVSKNCKVLTGHWLDPYSNQNFNDAKDLQIDHLVPLKHAHQMGACLWEHKKQVAFANDIENLLPVYGKLNQEKSDKPIDIWLPPNPNYTCDYTKKWVHIKEKYQLASTESERSKVNSLLGECQK